MKLSKVIDSQIMDTSIMVRMKELEAENSTLKKVFIEEKLKAEIITKAFTKKL